MGLLTVLVKASHLEGAVTPAFPNGDPLHRQVTTSSATGGDRTEA